MGATTDSLDAGLFDKEILDFSIDSRTVEPGELYFALSQPDYECAGFNGVFAAPHSFVAGALERGAGAGVARRQRATGADDLRPPTERLLMAEVVIAALQTRLRTV